ncbi:MAG: L-2-amino-thiazoline-4-carboxylic acid hydrolase [Clostridia bacterium]
MYRYKIKIMYKYIMKMSKEFLKENISQNLIDNRDVYLDFCKLADYKIEEILPEVQNIPGSEFLPKYYLAVCYIAFYYALTKMNETKDRAHQVIYGMIEATLKSIPEKRRRKMCKKFMSTKKRNAYKLAVKKLEANKANSLDWKISYKDEGENKFTIRVFECGALTLTRTLGLGAEDIFPGFCKIDFLVAKYLGYKLDRMGTLADGYECCDFKYSIAEKENIKVEKENIKVKEDKEKM